jgi:hypothetical protein
VPCEQKPARVFFGDVHPADATTEVRGCRLGPFARR